MKIVLAALCAARFIAEVDATPGAIDPDVRRSFAVTADNLSSYEAPANGGKQFTLNQIQNEKFQLPHAQVPLFAAHAKYGNSLPPQLKKAIEINPDLNRKFKSFFNQGKQPESIDAIPVGLTMIR